ncbi:MAG: hypothetical protein JHC95_12170 [Solirubrobacteraceae bacterium]|nr:hypothetical protein [Solirubrobacteraceae bacterium]
MRASCLSPVLFVVVLLGLLAPASASAEIEILNRGIAPSPLVEGTEASINVDVQVDQAPYIVELGCCGADSLDSPVQRLILDETSPETQGTTGSHRFTFTVPATTATDRIVTVRVSDSSGASKKVTFALEPTAAAPPPVPVEPAEPAGPTRQSACPAVVTFALVRARSTGSCWQQFKAGTNPTRQAGLDIEPRATFYETRGGFSLNGIPFPAPPSGTSYVLVEPTSDARGGQVGIDRSVTVDLGPITLFRGPIRFQLPAPGSNGKLAGFNLPAGTLGGLQVGGSVEVLFRNSGGRFSTSFPVQVTLPSIFKPFPGSDRGSVTGATEIRTEDGRGVSVDGGRIQIENVAIGKVALKQFCISYMSAGVSRSFSACEPPSLNGAPAVSCNPPARQLERFDASVLVGLPLPSRPSLGAYAGIAGGRFSYAGGFIDDAAIPLVAGVSLERVGFGVCVQNGLVLRGDGGLSFARGLVRGDASVTYAEPGRGFFIEAAAFVRVATIPVGNGRVRVDNTGFVDFDLNAQMRLGGGFLIVNGGLGGFIQPSPFLFSMDGRVEVCIELGIFGQPCIARAGVTVSSIGVGGCAGTFAGDFSAFFFWQQPRSGKRFDFGRGCGFQNRVRIARPRQAGAGFSFPVPEDPKQYVAHIQGAGAPPKVRITSPSGLVIESGSGNAMTDNKTYMMLENPEAPETSIFLPPQAAAGDWKIEALPGSTVTGVEIQADEKKPTVVTGKAKKTDTGWQLDLRYALRPGDKVSLDVLGTSAQQNVATGLRGKKCTDGKTLPGRSGSETRCATVRYTPNFSLGGTRTVKATVTDGEGAPVATATVATYRQAPPRPASRVPALRLVRRGTTVFAVWGSAATGTERYGSYAILSDGRKLGHNAPKTCFAWKIGNVAKTTSVRLQIQAGRQDLRFGGKVQQVLKPGAAYAGPKELRGAKIPKACASL